MVLLTIFITIFSLSTYAESIVELECYPVARCRDIKVKVDEINKSNIENENEIESGLKLIALDKDILFINIEKNNDVFKVYIEKSPLLRKVEVKGSDVDRDIILKLSQLSVGFPYPKITESEIVKKINAWMHEQGYRDIVVDYSKELVSDKINVKINVAYKSKLTISNVAVVGDNIEKFDMLFREMKKLVGELYTSAKVKLMLNRIMREIYDEGYYKSDAQLNYSTNERDNSVSVAVKVVLGSRYQYQFHGNENVDTRTLRELVKKESNEITVTDLRNHIKDKVSNEYRRNGYYGTNIEVTKQSYLGINKSKIVTYLVHIKEGIRYKVNKVSFIGNSLVSLQELKEFFYKRSSVLAARGFLDENFIESFEGMLQEYYLSRGFVYVSILKPEVIKDSINKKATINFFIKEKQQSIVESIKTIGLNYKLRKLVLIKIKNKKNKPVNIIQLESDITKSVNLVRGEGYYYARFIERGDIVGYKTNYSLSNIKLKYFLGRRLIVDKVLYTGNIVTKNIVLEREAKVEKGEYLSPALIKRIKDSLNSLGIFSRVIVTPAITSYNDNGEGLVRLLINVKEREFGRVEIAPGYRTDLGAKFSFSFLRNNLWGLNHSFNTKLLLNRRFTLRELDDRRLNGGHKIEGQLKLSYSWPYVFSNVSLDSTISLQRRRFYGFDADIVRISPQFSKQWNKYVGSSLKYQFEQIKQYDASSEDNQATFRIGGITPSVTLDFRDNSITPREGSYFGLSWEFANPWFGSQNDEDVEINFSKVISRNRFYYPILDKTVVFAVSLAMGYQKNYAQELQRDAEGNLIPVSDSNSTSRTRGYIPSIKVFRLDGYDLVRGFSDSEINRLDDGGDISLTRIQGSSYFANFKFEPRYYISESFVMGVFFDAGKIFVNNFKPLALRSAIGLTMKVITPVGSLDFDYGLKTRRRELGGGGKEGFGRFHLNIGTF
jgi:outer membrane protein insertion porin family